MNDININEINRKMEDFKKKNAKKIVQYVLYGIIAAILFGGAVGTVGAGERGILLQFGAVQNKVFDEGLYFK
ncbi:MAG: prohibitin family protein, partial [Patescibacteria group bacterium]|nr:prohibitin family protein [Patescibacteria group bacterium]